MKTLNQYINEKLILKRNIDTNDWVDMGLPSGTKWARCNVGAEEPTDYGFCVRWGETEEVNNPSFSNYKYTSPQGFTKYNNRDKKKILDSEDDIATVVMGNDWHLPTSKQWYELFDSTTQTWVKNYNGSFEQGVLVTAENGNELFFIADKKIDETARYWSNETTNSSTENYAYAAIMEAEEKYTVDAFVSEIVTKTLVLQVRAVKDK
jgi:hypothetical protein